MSNSVVAAEVARFDALAQEWWDKRGPMAPLHAMNPLRVGWADRHIQSAFHRSATVLDVGCGAGIAAEALARLGHNVTGIDAAPEVIAAAEQHCLGENLPLRYRTITAEALLETGQKYEAITALEVIEHVANPAAFIRSLAGLLAPGGVLVMSTINRTRRSYVTAKIGAEYVMRLLPIGTHAWKQFVAPAELAMMLRDAGLLVADVAGMSFNPLAGQWVISQDTSVNYIAAARKA